LSDGLPSENAAVSVFYIPGSEQAIGTRALRPMAEEESFMCRVSPGMCWVYCVVSDISLLHSRVYGVTPFLWYNLHLNIISIVKLSSLPCIWARVRSPLSDQLDKHSSRVASAT